MAQNWNNLLTYIKHELGAPSNKLEMTDTEIQSHITSIVMPEFSAYLGANIYYVLTDAMKITSTGTTTAYKLPLVADGTEVVEVNNAYFAGPNSGITSSNNATAGMVTDPAAIMMSTLASDAYNYMLPIRSFRFNAPDIIVFNNALTQMVVLDLDIIHTNPNTIPADMYHKAFKKQCLISVIDWIISMRSKYQTMQTPFGEVGLNIDFLQTKADRMRDEVKEVLNDIPPEPLVTFVI